MNCLVSEQFHAVPTLMSRSFGTKATGARYRVSVQLECGQSAFEGPGHYLMVPHHDAKVDKFCPFFCRFVVRRIYVGRVAIT